MKLSPVTHTSHKNYDNCPRKFWHINVAKDLPREDSEAMRWGNQVHSAMEARINKGTPLPESMTRFEPFCQYGPYMVKAEVKLGIRENGQPCGFFDSDVWMRGVIDVRILQKPVTGAAAIADQKTGKVREDPDELEMHAVLLKAELPALERITGWYNWLAECKPGRMHDLSATQAKLESIRKTRSEIEHAFRHGSTAFAPRQNPLCGWCPVKSCEYNGMFSR